VSQLGILKSQIIHKMQQKCTISAYKIFRRRRLSLSHWKGENRSQTTPPSRPPATRPVPHISERRYAYGWVWIVDRLESTTLRVDQNSPRSFTAAAAQVCSMLPALCIRWMVPLYTLCLSKVYSAYSNILFLGILYTFSYSSEGCAYHVHR